MAARRTSSDSGRKKPRGSADSLDHARSLRGAAITLLSRRDYSTVELRNKLLDRGYPAADIDALVPGLTSSGALNDRRVAASHVRTATAIKGRGRLRIARELAARGLPKDIVTEALGVVEKRDEAAAIRRILARKKWPASPSPADRRRMFQHLMRRGFPADAIGRALGGRDDQDWQP